MSQEFNTSELVIGGMFALMIDGACAFLDFFGIGLIVGPVMHSAFNVLLWWWLKSKGDKGASKTGRQIARYLVTVIPFVPVNLLTFAIETHFHNHPIGSVGSVLGPAGKFVDEHPAISNVASQIVKL